VVVAGVVGALTEFCWRGAMRGGDADRHHPARADLVLRLASISLSRECSGRRKLCANERRSRRACYGIDIAGDEATILEMS